MQERLRQQQYLRQQFIQQQQEERQHAAQAQLVSQAQAEMQDSWGRPEQKSFDAGSMRQQAPSVLSTPDKSHQLHSAPTRYPCLRALSDHHGCCKCDLNRRFCSAQDLR